MKKFLVIIFTLVVMMCFPVFADETEQVEETAMETAAETAAETATEAIVEEAIAEESIAAEENETEVTMVESAPAAENTESADEQQLYRVVLDFLLAIPHNAAERGLNPYYKVESSYTDDNGETFYVCAGGKGVVLSGSECTVQDYIEIDTDSEVRKQLIAEAMEKLGCPYAYARSGPDAFDCSGFVSYCMSSVGATVPRSSYSICRMDTKIDKSQLKAGDIVGTSGHVGIYIGNGCFVHAQDRANGVVTDFLDIYNTKSLKKFNTYINILD